MILVGSQRGGARDLALHLMKPENEHIVVHEVRGFGSDDLAEAFTEAYAISRGIKCEKFLFSLSLNPPKNEQVTTEAFEHAIDQAEERLGLTGQPRAIVFHEKEGRRHAHAVWSRINADSMKAVQLSYTKTKLNTLARELYLEHGWQMPQGFVDPSLKDPRNFTLAEWQQAKRIGKDPRAIKTAFQDAWAISDSRAAFARALEERGYHLAQGNRRSYVAVDCDGEVHSVARRVGIKNKEVRERLGKENDLPIVDDVKAQIALQMQSRMEQFDQSLSNQLSRKEAEFERRRDALVTRQKSERQALCEKLNAREQEEIKIRQARFTTGLRGVWDKLRGHHKRIRQQNEREAFESLKRDQALKDQLTFRHIDERQRLTSMKLRMRETFERQRQDISADRRRFAEQAKIRREHEVDQLPRGPTIG